MPLKMEMEMEFEYMTAFVRESFLDQEIARYQLRALWTAFCLHYNLIVDTSTYDNYMVMLWNVVDDEGSASSEWSDFDSFDMFMCEYLV